MIVLHSDGSVVWSRTVDSSSYVPDGGYQTVTGGFYWYPGGAWMDHLPSSAIFSSEVSPPVVMDLKYNPIWFGVVCVLMMEAGLMTPPVGLNVYTLAGIAKDVPMGEIFKGAMPFLLAIIATCIILTIWPKIALFLPSLMGG